MADLHPIPALDAPLTGGALLVRELLAQGADLAFCVPGESYLPVLDALHDVADRLRLVTCRQEGGAANMAEAYGKLTGRPGLCFVTRGPGATNAAIGVHTARQDSTPMILFIGQVARGDRDREAFQEVDYRAMFGPLAKWVAEIDNAERIPEYIARAYATAMSGRPGPVVLALPEDMLSDVVSAPVAAKAARIAAAPSSDAMAELHRLLSQAARPLIVVGGTGWTDQGVADLIRFAEANHLPVAASFRRQDLVNNDHPNYVGDVGLAVNPKLFQRLRDADLVVAIGARLGESMTGGYTLWTPPHAGPTLVHVHPGAEELGKVYAPTLAINADLSAFAAAAADMPPTKGARWQAWTREARADFVAWTTPSAAHGPVNMAEIMHALRAGLPDDAIVCNGAGNFSIWLHRFFRYRRRATQLAPTSGAMGYGFPAAVAAKATFPKRAVVALAGDGDFMMTGQELATAVHHKLPVIVIVVNNGMYGTIRMHQERRYPERVVATDLTNPDFVALAKAYGAAGHRVTRTAEFAAVLGTALQANTPTLIEIVLDPEDLTPRQTLSAIRAGGK